MTIARPMFPPVDSTRRRFLSHAAGVAAGGTALALATMSATADAAAPVASLAPSGGDPIFALIEEYRSTAKTLNAATSEHSRREGMLIEQGLGLSPFISVLDVRGPGPAQAVVAYKHEYIDRHIPADRFSEPNAAAHASLDAQIEPQGDLRRHRGCSVCRDGCGIGGAGHPDLDPTADRNGAPQSTTVSIRSGCRRAVDWASISSSMARILRACANYETRSRNGLRSRKK